MPVARFSSDAFVRRDGTSGFRAELCEARAKLPVNPVPERRVLARVRSLELTFVPFPCYHQRNQKGTELTLGMPSFLRPVDLSNFCFRGLKLRLFYELFPPIALPIPSDGQIGSECNPFCAQLLRVPVNLRGNATATNVFSGAPSSVALNQTGTQTGPLMYALDQPRGFAYVLLGAQPVTYKWALVQPVDYRGRSLQIECLFMVVAQANLI